MVRTSAVSELANCGDAVVLIPAMLPCTTYVLSKAAQQARALLEELLEPLDIRVKHFSFLVLLAEGMAQTQTDLGRALAVDRTTVVAVLDDLERMELVERRTDPADRRANLVHLSAKGSRVLEKARQAAAVCDANFLEKLTGAEREQFHSLLMKLLGSPNRA